MQLWSLVTALKLIWKSHELKSSVVIDCTKLATTELDFSFFKNRLNEETSLWHPLDWDLVTGGYLICYVQETSLRCLFFIFVTWCIAGSSCLKSTLWVHCDHNGIDMFSNNTRWLWHLNDAKLAPRGAKCATKISSTLLHQHHRSEMLIQCETGPCFHFVQANF